MNDSFAQVTDDAADNNDATTTAGSLSFASPVLSWSGNLAVGAVATITYSVTVSKPDGGITCWPIPSPRPPPAATAR